MSPCCFLEFLDRLRNSCEKYSATNERNTQPHVNTKMKHLQIARHSTKKNKQKKQNKFAVTRIQLSRVHIILQNYEYNYTILFHVFLWFVHIYNLQITDKEVALMKGH